MKRIIYLFCLVALPVFGAMDIREAGTDCVTGAVSVSTTTPTAIPASAITGRYKIDILNYNGIYNLAIGTHSAITYAAGFIVTSTATAATAKTTLNLPSGKSIYGIGEANTVTGTINVRFLECK